MRIYVILFLSLLWFGQPASAAAPDAPRDVRLLSGGWVFAKGAQAGAEQADFDDSAWRAVTVPHDYSIEGRVFRGNPSGPAGGFFPGGVGWYRTKLHLDRVEPGRRTYIVFDGVMANSDVWINGQHLGRRPNGYVSFVYELTRHLKPGANVIAVRADNEKEPSVRWYLGAGIYRQVRLVTTGDTHIAPWGTFVTTPQVGNDKATVNVRSSITAPAAGRLALNVLLRDPAGKVVATLRGKEQQVAGGQALDLSVEGVLARPQRWDIDSPAMYSAEVTLLRNGRAVDNEIF